MTTYTKKMQARAIRVAERVRLQRHRARLNRLFRPRLEPVLLFHSSRIYRCRTILLRHRLQIVDKADYPLVINILVDIGKRMARTETEQSKEKESGQRNLFRHGRKLLFVK
jgi:hypothetical protein